MAQTLPAPPDDPSGPSAPDPTADRRTVAGTTFLRAGSMGGSTMARSWRRQLTHTLAALAVAAAVVGTGARAEAAAQPPRDTSRYACPASTPNPFSDIAGNTHESAIRCMRSEEHTSELQSLMRLSYAVFCLNK